jgi:hypothetical protein
MSLSPGYVLEFGDVWLHGGEGRRHSYPVCTEGEGLAVAYDPDGELVYKHGHQGAVTTWFDDECRYNEALEIFRFPAVSRTVELLNLLVAGALRLAEFVEALEDYLFGPSEMRAA